MSPSTVKCRLKSVVVCPVKKSDGAARPFVGLENIGSGTGALTTDELPEKVALDSVRHRPGDVLFSKLRPYLAKSFLSTAQCTGTGELLVLRPQAKIDRRFLLYMTLSSPWLEWAETTSYGTKMPRTSWEAMSEYRFDLPSIEEQCRIADLLDVKIERIDRLREATALQVDLLGRRRLEEFRIATTGSSLAANRATGIAWMPRMAEEWNLFRVGRSFRTASGTTPRSGDPAYFDGSHYWVNTGDLRDGVVNLPARQVSDAALRDYPTLRIYPPGALMVAMYGATTGRVGINAVPACVNQACCVLISGGDLEVDYAFYWFLAHRSEIIGLASGGGQPNISQDLVRMLCIPAPRPTREQRMVANECREIAVDTITQQAQLTRRDSLLAERRQALITAAVTGQIDVTTARGVDV